MNLFYQEPTTEARGTDSPDGFLFPDVYYSEEVKKCLPEEKRRTELLTDLLHRFKKKDYGEITSFEFVDNMAQRHIFFSYTWMHARYQTEIGVICLELLYDLALFYPQRENIDALRQAQSVKDKENAGAGWRV